MRSRLAVVVLAAMLGVAGCGSMSGRERGAAEVAQRFLESVENGDGEAACAVLAPDTVAEVEESAGQPCADAVLDADLPGPAEVEATDVYGQLARVRLADDTVFAAMFPGGWRVMAAGCQSRGELPYDCSVKGG
jgi:ketosteroid isomerase-like protein